MGQELKIKMLRFFLIHLFSKRIPVCFSNFEENTRIATQKTGWEFGFRRFELANLESLKSFEFFINFNQKFEKLRVSLNFWIL